MKLYIGNDHRGKIYWDFVPIYDGCLFAISNNYLIKHNFKFLVAKNIINRITNPIDGQTFFNKVY